MWHLNYKYVSVYNYKITWSSVFFTFLLFHATTIYAFYPAEGSLNIFNVLTHFEWFSNTITNMYNCKYNYKTNTITNSITKSITNTITNTNTQTSDLQLFQTTEKIIYNLLNAHPWSKKVILEKANNCVKKTTLTATLENV